VLSSAACSCRQSSRPRADPQQETEGSNVPTGKVKWFNPEKGFGFLAREDGPDVFVHKDALPSGTAELKPGQRVEFGIVAGKRGDQALQVRVLDPLPSVAASVREQSRKKPDEMVPIIEDLIKLLDEIGEGLRHNRHPDRQESRKVASVLRAVAADLEG
jgi:CspA family cold shock protein